MKRIPHYNIHGAALLLVFFISIRVYSQIIFNNPGDTYSQNFNTLASAGNGNSWTDNLTLLGWYSNLTSYNAGTGSGTTGALYSYGVVANSERAFGSLASAGSGTIYYGLRIKNNSCYPFTSFDIIYTGEQWRDANTTVQKLSFQYQNNASALTGGSWTNYVSLDFSSPQNSAVGAINGNTTGNGTAISSTITLTVPPGEEIWFRFMDIDDAGSDHGLALDDISITANGNIGQTYWYFRSVTDGNWNVNSTWEASCDNISWVAATEPPTYLSKSIVIRVPNEVTITTSVIIDNVIVDYGAELIYGYDAGSIVTINDGNGVDLIINGKFEDSGPSSVVWNSSSSWLLGNDGTIIRTRSTSANNWRDRYNGGISSIPSTANWIVRKNSTDNPTISSVGGMYYPNLIIENDFSSAWITTASSSFTGISDYPRVKGNLDIGGNGSNTISFLNDNVNAIQVLVIGNLIIRNGSIVRNYGTGFELQANLVVDGTIVYDTDHSRKISFTGSNSQEITGNGVLNIFDMDVNKSFNDITLNRPITIDFILNLVKGKIFSTLSNKVSLIDGASATGASDNSFINGPCSKTGITDFIFPIGKDLKFRPVGVSILSASSTFTAEYFNTDPDNAGYDNTSLENPPIDHISQCEYWMLENSGDGNSAKVTLSWDTYSCGVTSPSALLIAGWDGSMWLSLGNGGTTGNNATGTIISAGQINTFGAFTLSSLLPIPDNPLPLELINFSGKQINHVIELSWITCSEIHTEYFEIIRSQDGISNQPIGKIKAAGISTIQKKYFFIDDNPKEGINYYQYRVKDFGENYSYSNWIAVNFNLNPQIIIYPTPVQKQLFIVSSENISLIIFNILGKEILNTTIFPDQQSSVNFSSFPNGIYFVKMFNGFETTIRKVLKE